MRRRAIAALAAAVPIAGVAFAAVGTATARVAHAASATVNQFAIPTASSTPSAITSGPNNTLWFTEKDGNNIGRITTGGTITEFRLPTAGSEPRGITMGSDGNLWFTERSNNAIGRITPSGVITEFAVPTSGAGPAAITAGPDGNLWFTEPNAGQIGRVTTSGAFAEYSSGACYLGGSIVTGPDLNLWFLDVCAGQVGRISIGGAVNLFFLGCCPNDIASGPDGNIWLAGTDNNTRVAAVTRMPTSGPPTTEFATPSPGSTPQNITAGANGAMWMTDSSDQIFESSTAGAMTAFPLPTSGVGAGAITSGPDGNMWFVEGSGNAIGELVVPASCATFSISSAHASVGPGVNESVSLTVQNCGGTDTLTGTTTSTTTTPPSGCTAPAITELSADIAPGQSATSTTTFAAPYCDGTYNISSQASDSGGSLGSASGSYTVAYGALVEYPTIARPQSIVTGSDGNLWYTRGQSSSIGGYDIASMTPGGVETLYSSPIYHPGAIAAGPNGHIWVAGYQAIASMDTYGNLATLTQLPKPHSITTMVAGPDGNIWFPGSAGHIGRITMDGNAREFGGLPPDSGAGDMAAGPDGNVWFTLDSQVGKLTPKGAVTLYAMPAGISAEYIALGPDGNMWVLGTNATDGVVIQMKPDGTVLNQYTVGPTTHYYGFVQGGDGNLYFNVFSDMLGRVTPAGVVTVYPAGNGANSQHLAEGPDGNIWLAEYYGFKIGQFGIAPPAACTTVHDSISPATVAQGQPETLTVSVKNCAGTPARLKVSSKTTPPAGCGTVTTANVAVPLAPRTGTTETSTFNAPNCPGTYKVKTTVSVGGSVVGTNVVTYQVT